MWKRKNKCGKKCERYQGRGTLTSFIHFLNEYFKQCSEYGTEVGTIRGRGGEMTGRKWKISFKQSLSSAGVAQ